MWDAPNRFRGISKSQNLSEMLEKVDDGSMGFTPAVQLSFLKKKEQKEMLDAMDCHSVPRHYPRHSA